VPGDPHPFTLDMATSAAARGKVMTASLRGEPIPSSWALDVDGQPTTDAQRALEGVLSPFGGHKGSGLGFMMSLFTGPLLGVAREVDGPSTALPTGARHKGDFFWVFDPEMFGPSDAFIAGVKAFADHVRSSPRVEGVDVIRLPGERAYETREVRLREGIDVDDGVWKGACEVADRFGVSTNLGS
jgi:LDH2 family malate/lactate/ureidoglycolate dehydrogenase